MRLGNRSGREVMTTTFQRMAGREVARRAVRARITTAATALCHERGFEETTVEAIAAAAGVSSRSVFRHFASKEEIITSVVDEIGAGITIALASRPPAEEAWVALRRAMDGHLHDLNSDVDGAQLARAVLLFSTPSLRAAMLNKRARWIEAMVPDVIPRLRGPSGNLRDVQAHAIVSAALACLTSAVERWARLNGTHPVDEILDVAIAAVRS
jgi:AcrR family transcriptional regulator